MKQKRLISFIGTVCVFMGALFMMTGCPTQQNPQIDSSQVKEQDEKPKPQTFTITYEFPDCTSTTGFSNDWKLKSQTAKSGEEITLAKDGSESTSGKPWKVEYVKHKDSKAIKGWSKSKNSETVDYAFGEKIKPTGNMTLYPALSKYGMGDVIDGKTVIYVRHGKKDKIQTQFLLEGTYTDYNVIGENWRYIAADVDAGKNSEKKQWSSLAKNIISSNGIGGGKENTEKILAAYSHDDETNNAAKYCKHISPNGYLPSEAEVFLIFKAIRDKKITGLPTFSQITHIGGSFSGDVAHFWTSTQHDVSNAYAINLVKDELIYSGKTERAKIKAESFVCPIIYYDDDGNVVK
ncbi:InlB B-repeat-containing protein [Treponema sp. OMZ 906]|uniref:InlB B-repeat-containing protein n=1 Tax=Treponema sp. OMZ 906 TaxID=2563662 RepID=UPI0020A4A9B7|nr:InlB B-repeat-containing protein [Treponema sp. OMZ 906]UTC55574.1 InlB B-repeat-containing protein [Treponema sp. OMZ 906]